MVISAEHMSKDTSCHSTCGTLKNSFCSMAIKAKHNSKHAALYLWTLNEWKLFWLEYKNRKKNKHQQSITLISFNHYNCPVLIIIYHVQTKQTNNNAKNTGTKCCQINCTFHHKNFLKTWIHLHRIARGPQFLTVTWLPSEGLIFAYQQAQLRIQKNYQWMRKAAL